MTTEIYIYRNKGLLKTAPLTTSPSMQLSISGNRSGRLEVFCKIDVLRYLAKFTGKHLYQGLFFNKVGGLNLNTYSYITPPIGCLYRKQGMELTQSICHRDFIELGSDEKNFKEEPLSEAENKILVTFSDC